MLVVALPFSSKSWPCTSLLIATDIAFGTIPKIASLALILNLLTKTLIINEGIRQKNYRAIVLNSASTAALLSLPQGWLIAAIIDLFFTVLCSYTHPLSKEKPMTTSVIQQLNPSGENQTALVLRPVPVDLSTIAAGALAGTGIGIASRLSFP